MIKKVLKIVIWAVASITILFVLFLITEILVIADRTTIEFHSGKMNRVMVGYLKDGKAILHYPAFYKNDSLLLKTIAGSDPSSVDSVYISPFMEISNEARPFISWAFPRWELVIDKYSVRKGRKFNSMTMLSLVKSQGYFYLPVIVDVQASRRKIRISTLDQLPSCAIPR